MGVADHPKREDRLLTVDDPVSTENFVSAVLGVDLREHDKLGIGRVVSFSGRRLLSNRSGSDIARPQSMLAFSKALGLSHKRHSTQGVLSG